MRDMKKIALINPFGGPVYHVETVSSTMDVSRFLANQGEPHGTVILADFQESGRGRTLDRYWKADRAKNLFFTLLLRYDEYAAFPQALTLKIGLAISLGIEDFLNARNVFLQDQIQVKWPNDIMIGSKKIAGILTEGDGKTVYIGIGINMAQTEFPENLQTKAASIALACNTALCPEDRFPLLEKILVRLFQEITAEPECDQWRTKLLERLYLRNSAVRFVPGPAGSPDVVEGCLQGISLLGELLIIPNGHTQVLSFITGELDVYGSVV
jgi:BirA family biotin operon repressor/biotin-[acetyl-CoA-carboxylase] ligase